MDFTYDEEPQALRDAVRGLLSKSYADYENRRAITEEALQFIKTAFATDGRFSFDGRFHQYENLQLSVRPLQKPHPPLWIESRDPKTLEFLAAGGTSMAYVDLGEVDAAKGWLDRAASVGAEAPTPFRALSIERPRQKRKTRSKGSSESIILL